MRFSAVVLIVPEEDENRAVDILKQAGATGITILKGKGLRPGDRKTFLGAARIAEHEHEIVLFQAANIHRQIFFRLIRNVVR